MDHHVVLGAAFAVILLLTVTTIAVAVLHGPDVLTVVSVLVLAVLGFGVFGALRDPPA